MRPPDPHILIGGFPPPIDPIPCDGFDAYCATIYAEPESLFDELTCLMESAGFAPREVEGKKAPYYAKTRLLIDDKDEQLLILKSGGANPHPFVQCTGRASQTLARYLRERVGHRPSRIDHAVDVRAKGAFDGLLTYARKLCKDYRLKLSFGGDWNNPDAGRTVYVGSRTSQVYVRIYEKGLEYAHKVGADITDELREWVRVELEFKPQTRVAKESAAGLEGVQMWGSAKWTRQLAEEVLSMPTEPINLRLRRESNTDRALRFCAMHYGRAFRSHWASAACSDATAIERLKALGVPVTQEALQMARQSLFGAELLYRAGIIGEEEVEVA